MHTAAHGIDHRTIMWADVNENAAAVEKQEQTILVLGV